MKQLLGRIKFGAAFAAGVFALVARAEKYTWNGSAETAASWTDSANWLVDGQPTDACPTSSTDTAVFEEGSVAVFDLALDNAAGGGAKITVGAGANVTVKSTASAAPTFTCAPTVAANGSLTFDHVKFGGANTYLAATSDSSIYRFINGAEYAPGWISSATGSGGGVWYFEDSTFGFNDQLPLGKDNKYRHDVVLVNTVAGGKNNSKHMAFGKAGWLYVTNSVLTLNTNMGDIDISTTTSGQKGMVISGDDCQLSVYQVKAGSGSVMEFDYGRTDRPALTIGAGGFVPDAATKLIVDVTEKTDEVKEVPLIACTGTMTIPEKWLTMDADSVTADEYVKRLYLSDDGKTLMATLAKPSTDTAPSGRVVIEDAVVGAHDKSVKTILDDRGVGAAATSITVALYSDAERTSLVKSIAAATDRSESSYDVTATFGDLVLDTPYYVRVTLSNDLGEKTEIDDDFTFRYPLPTGSTFAWCGWGDGVSWTDPANWGVCEGYPSGSTQMASFSGNAILAFDVDDLVGFTDVKIRVESGAMLSITNAAAELRTLTCTPTIGANAVMTFDHVKLNGFPASASTNSRYQFVNGAEYSPGWISGKGDSAGVWMFEDSVFGFTDQMPLGQGNHMQDVVLVNSTAGGDSKGRNMQLAGYLYMTNSVLRMSNSKDFGIIGVKDSTAYERGIVISGDESLITSYVLNLGKKTALEFDYGNRKRAAIEIGEGGFTADTTAKLIVRVPPTLRRNGEVPLVSCTGAMTIPEGWLALNPECVEFPKQLTGLAVKEVDGVKFLMANFTVNKGFAVIVVKNGQRAEEYFATLNDALAAAQVSAGEGEVVTLKVLCELDPEEECSILDLKGLLDSSKEIVFALENDAIVPVVQTSTEIMKDVAANGEALTATEPDKIKIPLATGVYDVKIVFEPTT